MRWYQIVINNNIVQDATNNPYALNIIFDLPITQDIAVQPGAYLSIQGISLAELLGARSYNSQPITIYGGMQPGLPLAVPSQRGILAQGVILPAYGNWIGLDKSIDMNIVSSSGGQNPPDVANIVHNVTQGQTLSSAIQQTLSTAFPNYTPQINISSSLVCNAPDTGYYKTLAQYAKFISDLATSIINSSTYLGIKIVPNGNNLLVYDGTQSISNIIQVNFQDLIGQPIWTGPNTIQFKAVLRGDIKCGSIVSMPNSLAILTQTAAFTNNNSQNLSGNFMITRIRHTGNFRQPDWSSWCTTFDGILASSSGTVNLQPPNVSQANIN
jgi:hypothetical protein